MAEIESEGPCRVFRLVLEGFFQCLAKLCLGCIEDQRMLRGLLGIKRDVSEM
jgi:hypothetical protein